MSPFPCQGPGRCGQCLAASLGPKPTLGGLLETEPGLGLSASKSALCRLVLQSCSPAPTPPPHQQSENPSWVSFGENKVVAKWWVWILTLGKNFIWITWVWFNNGIFHDLVLAQRKVREELLPLFFGNCMEGCFSYPLALCEIVKIIHSFCLIRENWRKIESFSSYSIYYGENQWVVWSPEAPWDSWLLLFHRSWGGWVVEENGERHLSR